MISQHSTAAEHWAPQERSQAGSPVAVIAGAIKFFHDSPLRDPVAAGSDNHNRGDNTRIAAAALALRCARLPLTRTAVPRDLGPAGAGGRQVWHAEGA